MSKHNIVKATFALLDDNGDLIKDAVKGLSTDGIYVDLTEDFNLMVSNINSVSR